MYLVELMYSDTGDVAEADVCAHLDVALDKAYLHLQTLDAIEGPRAEVSFDDEGELEGVGFFDADENMLACVTVYHLDRDNEQASVAAIAAACAGPRDGLQDALNALLRRG